MAYADTTVEGEMTNAEKYESLLSGRIQSSKSSRSQACVLPLALVSPMAQPT